MPALLSTNLDVLDSVPYFLWDEPMTVSELRDFLRDSSVSEQARLIGKILREARDIDVWRFITPGEALRRWDEISPYLGRRRLFWKYLLWGWKKDGLLDN